MCIGPPLTARAECFYNTVERAAAPTGAVDLLEFRRDVRTLIRERTSVRTYRPLALPPDRRKALEEACDRLTRGPLGTPCRFRLLDRTASELAGGRPQREGAHSAAASRGERLGTYGVIRGAAAYLAGAARRGPSALIDFGYLFELLVLKAAELGLGTCWLGGTFRRSDFDRALQLQDGEILPAVSPVGVPAARRSLVDRLFRLGAGSKARRPWGELFFGSSGRPLEPDAAPPAYREALEMVRLGPSASNRQPWRVVHAEEAVHFLLHRTPGYRRASGLDLQQLDIGIAMAHFELGLGSADPQALRRGRWQVLQQGSAAEASTGHAAPMTLPPTTPEFRQLEYLVSWRR